MIQWSDKMDLIDKFLEKRLITNPNTQRNYRRGIELFFQTMKKDINTYFNNSSDYEEDVGKYYLTIEKAPPMTIKNRINAIRLFINTNDKAARDLDIWDTMKVKLKGAEGVSKEKSLDKEDIKKILQYGDLNAKAMYLIMASSGCRIESIVGLLPSDIHDDEKPTRIHFRREIVKGKKHSITSFITEEATETYHAWMKVRDNYLKTAVKRTSKRYGRKTAKDDRVFPMTDVNARIIWRNMVTKAGYDKRDPKTNRLTAHTHSLRKFFRSYLHNRDLAEHLMGHRGYLSQYRQYDDNQLAKEYNKVVHNLTIFEKDVTDERIENLDEQLKDKDKEIEKLQKRIDELDWAVRKLGIKKLVEEDEKKIKS